MLRSLPTTFRFLVAAAIAATAVACDSQPTGPDEEALAGGVLATFQVSGEEFQVWTDDPGTVDQLLALESGERQASIPNGALVQGPGPGDHNNPWSWHMDPDDVAMAEVTVEVCDGRPSMVEEDLDHWMIQVSRFCPWGAELVELRGFR